MKHLIIGAGAAAVSAVRRILKEKPEDTVVIVSQDEEVYSRCMLHKFISGERDAPSINFINDDIFAHKNVQWIKGKTITRLDGATKTVYAGDEKIASGDTVLIATGSNSVTPPIGELKTAKNAFGLRHLSDARAIAGSAKSAKEVVIIGAGLVGLDAAYALLELGKKLTIIEMAPTALAINLDAHGAEAYQKLFEAKGVTFHLARKVVNTKGDGAGNITGVEMDNGVTVPCDMVVMAVGVRAAIAFLEGSGVKTERAVVVDDYLATSVPGIYAAGDVAGLSGIWPNAQKQGEMAAYNMTGTKWAYDDRFAIKNTINFFGLPSLSLGAINPQEGDTVLVKEDRGNYRKIILRDGAPAGVILQGEIGGSGFWLHLIKNKIRIDKLGKSPWKVTYADFFGLEANGEYKYVV
ncbi:NAD(P)/FAD-dependent oxidoreductase [Leadbettera azotonutricia]|uniref:Nitrate reductase, NADH oxidase subunit n=1 Tax=Leadbettera azotonutricia (strain ATCC BAA-888 / DSM 13862 / ZAS-9) TaxID=545695 RepID=F5YE21_LEAAZ|nr:FAD-dependent oxidoreductase [Leadbettera azotonutricia]AEF83187.1 nitrate reductase, NADH oxidase subunit [Leadbettera azotonutricia ZAS-9]